MTDECEHGSLRRSCEICERDAEIESLRAEIEAGEKLRAFAHECNMKQRDSLRAEVAERDKRIDKAWKYVQGVLFATNGNADLRRFAREIFERLGIVACEECGGSGTVGQQTQYPEPLDESECPSCGGHGWKVVSGCTLDSEGE